MAKKKQMIPEKTKLVEIIPQDLKDKWSAIEACATAANILDKGYYPHNYATVVKSSIGFLAKLHEQCVEEALKHPQAHMISELKEALKEKKAAANA